MKRVLLVFAVLLVLSGTFIFQSCEEEPVAFTKYGAFTIPGLVAPANNAFISPAGTTVELKWSSTDADNDTQNWDVYFGQSEEPAKVASSVTTQSYTVTVVKGTKYYWRVVGHDANNIPTRSEIWNFEIVDPAAPLKVKMDWSTNVLDAIGVDMPAEQVIDLRLLILRNDKVTPVTTINTTGFEEYAAFNTLADGKYYIATYFTKTLNAGDLNQVLDVSINLNFAQRGTLANKLVYPTVMTNEFDCSDYKTILASVTKTGNTYVIETATELVKPDPSILAGTWSGDDEGYPSEIETTVADGTLYIDGVGIGWMWDGWGEIATETFPAEVIFNTCAGTITIPQQEFMNTTWLGDPQPTYSIKGSGTIDMTGATPKLIIQYDFIQVDGAGAIARYFGIPYFTAEITLDPATKSALMSAPSVHKGLKLVLPKPAHK